MMYIESIGIDVVYLKDQVRILNEVLKPTKARQALHESKILGLFLVQLSFCLIGAFLTAFYLHYAWASLFAVFLVIGSMIFYCWWKKIAYHSDLHRGNHFALALACRALNWQSRNQNNYDRKVKIRPGHLAKWVEFIFE